MKRALIGLMVGAGCWACGETGSGAGDTMLIGGEAGTGGTAAAGEAAGATGGSGQGGTVPGGGRSGSPSMAGTPASGGQGGAIGGVGAMGGVGSGEGGAGMAGADGSGENCNDLELIEMSPPCSALGAPVPEQGGTLVEGTYALVAYQMPICLNGLEQTIRIRQTAPNTYDVETVANLGAVRANSTFVRQALILASTSTCGSDEVDEPYGYTAFEDQGVAHLRLANQGTFTYRRVSD